MTSKTTPELSLIPMVASPPRISLQILGTHMNGPTEVIDFDLWIDCSKGARISSGEFLTHSRNALHSWSESGSSVDFVSASSGWLRDWLQDRRGKISGFVHDIFCSRHGQKNKKNWTIQSLATITDEDFAAVHDYIKEIAHRAYYGGSITVQVHGPKEEEASAAKHTAIIRVGWLPTFPWNLSDTSQHYVLSKSTAVLPSSPLGASPSGEKSWDQVIHWAMLYRRKGFLSFDEPLPRPGQSPLRRARTVNAVRTVMVRNGTEWERVDLQCVSSWGSDIYICD